MGNFLYIVAIILVLTWAIGLFGYNAGGLIHLALVFAVVAVLFRVSTEKKAL